MWFFYVFALFISRNCGDFDTLILAHTHTYLPSISSSRSIPRTHIIFKFLYPCTTLLLYLKLNCNENVNHLKLECNELIKLPLILALCLPLTIACSTCVRSSDLCGGRVHGQGWLGYWSTLCIIRVYFCSRVATLWTPPLKSNLGKLFEGWIEGLKFCYELVRSQGS